MKQLEFDFSGINLLDHYKFHEVIDEGKNDLMSWSDTFSDDGEKLSYDDIIVCGDATACIVPFQVSKLKKGQRMFSNSGCASMGYDLPASIGAAIAEPKKRIICLAGDGSIQMNIQELQVMQYLGMAAVMAHGVLK